MLAWGTVTSFAPLKVGKHTYGRVRHYPLRMARTRFTEIRAALTCTNEARDRERPSIGVDASGDRHRSLDRAAHHDSKHVPMRRPLPSHKPLFGTYFRAVAMRLVRCGCRGRLAPTVLRGSPTAEGKTAQGSLKRLSVASSGDPRVTKARDGSVQPGAVRARNGGANIDRWGASSRTPFGWRRCR
jgi:hypothetical protein